MDYPGIAFVSTVAERWYHAPLRQFRDALSRHPEEHGQFRLGLRSALSLGLAPIGARGAGFHRGLDDEQRQKHGLIVILPGIEGCSSINDSIARGLVAARVPHAIRIPDWRRFHVWNPLHLAMKTHNRKQAGVVADVVVDYQRNFPGQPVHLIGHSAGAGMALFTLDALPESCRVESVILLAAAVSREFDAQALAQKTERGLWNFFSPLDLPTVGLGTMIFGTMDRRHACSAGALGFRCSTNSEPKDQVSPKLFQVPYRKSMVREWNFGGHFGATNAAFVRRHLAPLLR